MENEQIMTEKEKIRIAVCGNLTTTCEELEYEENCQIDFYSDASSLAFQMRDGVSYHLILVYAPSGEGLLDTSYPYKKKTEKEWKEVPIRLLNEPACRSARLELRRTIKKIRANLREGNGNEEI